MLGGAKHLLFLRIHKQTLHRYGIEMTVR